MLNLLKKIRAIPLVNKVVAFLIKKLGWTSLYSKWPLKGNIKLNILNQNVLFHSNCDDYLVSGYYYEGFDEEIYEIELLDDLIKKTNVFFDIGTFNGLFSIILGKIHPNLRICSFEPNPANFERTNFNIKLNKLANISTFNIGVSDKEGSLDFFIPYDRSLTTVSSFDPVFFNRHSGVTPAKFEVEIMSIDSFCEMNNIYPEFIKIDVEGHETEVINGSLKIIEKHKPIILCEIFTRKFASDKLFEKNLPNVSLINEIFKDQKYTIFTIDYKKLIAIDSLNIDNPGRNFLFIPKEVQQKFHDNF